jgi:hypothetical protein
MLTIFSPGCGVLMKKNTAQCWISQAYAISQVYDKHSFRLIT